MSYSLTRVRGRCAGTIAMAGSARVASMTSGLHWRPIKRSRPEGQGAQADALRGDGQRLPLPTANGTRWRRKVKRSGGM